MDQFIGHPFGQGYLVGGGGQMELNFQIALFRLEWRGFQNSQTL